MVKKKKKKQFRHCKEYAIWQGKGARTGHRSEHNKAQEENQVTNDSNLEKIETKWQSRAEA